MENTIIKILHKTDYKEAFRLAWNVFMEFEAPDYTREGITEFKMAIEDEAFIEQLKVYGAYHQALLIGILATQNEGKHIALFFVDKTFQKQGIGKRLFETAQQMKEDKTMSVNSSPYAIPVYQHLGFQCIDKEQIHHGIRFTPMILKNK